jgi:outer membrane protein assembly factor BamA
MKALFFIFLLIIVSLHVYGQERREWFFDEINISLNRTNLKNDNTDDRNGFGLGVARSFMSGKRFNILFGMEYNRTSQFKKSIYEGHFTSSKDVTFTLNCISVPFGFRYNFGNKLKVFIDSGIFTDIMINSNRKGTKNSFYSVNSLPPAYHETQFNENAGLQTSAGISFGIGTKIPIGKYELIIRPDYKFGVNELISLSMDQLFCRYMRLVIGMKLK